MFNNSQVICGDCLDAMKLLDSNLVDLVVL